MAPVPGDSSKHQFGTSMPQGGHPPHHSIISSAAGLDVVRCTRIAPEIVLAATIHEFVRQLPLAPQFSDELRVQDRMCLGSDRAAAVSCTYPVHEHGLVARIPQGKRRCDWRTQETGSAYQE